MSTDTYCGTCGYPCDVKVLDWGIAPGHHVWELESDCCGTVVYQDEALRIEYRMADYERDRRAENDADAHGDWLADRTMK